MCDHPRHQSTSDETAVLVIIVAYQAGSHLQRCLDALERQTFTDWRAIIWDNASSDGAPERLVTSKRTEVVRSDVNLGFAAANNRAAARLATQFIATLNPDAFPEPNWLSFLIATAEKHQVAAVGSLQLDDLNPDRLDGAGDCMSFAGVAWRGGYGQPRAAAPVDTCEVFAPCAAAALYRRDVFERLGGFDERFFCYYEDVDLGFRIRLAGGVCLLEPRAIVRHVGSAITGQISGFAEYHGFRNRIWSFLRNMPTILLPLSMPAHIVLTLYILSRSPTNLPVKLRALRDAIAGCRPFLEARVPVPRGVTLKLIAALTWSPIAVRTRAVRTRQIPGAPVRNAPSPGL